MKKALLLFTTFISLTISVEAQSFANPSFEDWHNVSVLGSSLSLEAPNSWYGTDSLLAALAFPASLAGIQIEPQKQVMKSNNSHSGTYAVELKSAFVGDTVGNIPGVFSNAQANINLAGLLMGSGSDNLSDILQYVSYTGGTNITARVDTVSAWILFSDTNADSATILATTVKIVQNSSNQDSTVIVGSGSLTIAPMYNQYQQVFVPIIYPPGSTNIPEKLIVAFFSSNIADSVHDGNTLLVDDAAFSYEQGGTAIYRPLLSKDKLLVYPNPAANEIYFNLNVNERATDYTLSIADINGRVIYQKQLQQQVNAQNVEGWAKGNYFYNLVNSKNGKAQNGKFTVE